MALRQSREAVDLFAAVPKTGVISPARYNEALRSRLNPIRDIGAQQTGFVMEQAALKDAQRRQALMSRLTASQAQQAATYSGQPVQASNGKWYHPLGTSMAPTFGFGAKYRTPVAGHDYHQGVDFAVKSGTPVYAPFGGTLGSLGFGKTGFGNELRLNLSNGLLGILGHLSGFAPNLKAGMAITPGMLLGYSGNTGNSTGDHLHYELRDRYGRVVNPGTYHGW